VRVNYLKTSFQLICHPDRAKRRGISVFEITAKVDV